MASPSHAKSLLVVDDDPAFRRVLVQEFQERGYVVFAAGTPAEVRVALAEGSRFDFAILDLRLGNDLGLSLIDALLAATPGCRVVMLTGYPTTATTVQAIRKGAVNCLLKPSHPDLLEQALWIDGVDPAFELEASDTREGAPSLAQYEHELIEFVLAQCDWNVTQAARRLGLHRQSLQRKMRKLPQRVDPGALGAWDGTRGTSDRGSDVDDEDGEGA